MSRGPFATATSVSLLPYDGMDPAMTWDGIGVSDPSHSILPGGEGIINAPIPPQHLVFDVTSGGGEDTSSVSSSSFVSRRGTAHGSEFGDTMQMTQHHPDTDKMHHEGPMSFWNLLKFVAVILWSIVAIFVIWYLISLRQPIHSIAVSLDDRMASILNSTATVAQNIQDSLQRATSTPIIGFANPFAIPPPTRGVGG